jgi:hypothetical protein
MSLKTRFLQIPPKHPKLFYHFPLSKSQNLEFYTAFMIFAQALVDSILVRISCFYIIPAKSTPFDNAALSKIAPINALDRFSTTYSNVFSPIFAILKINYLIVYYVCHSKYS